MAQLETSDGDKDDVGPVRPQLYDAPDPEEDTWAASNMEELATLAAQTQRSVVNGNAQFYGNATEAVVNETRAFFQVYTVYGVRVMWCPRWS